MPFEPSAVGTIRAKATAKLEEWGLSELSFGTELVLSELITNAIRHGAEPVRVRLLFDRVLTCEVFDGSSSSPRLHYATTTDEGAAGSSWWRSSAAGGGQVHARGQGHLVRAAPAGSRGGRGMNPLVRAAYAA